MRGALPLGLAAAAGLFAPALAQNARPAHSAPARPVAAKSVNWMKIVVKTHEGGFRMGNPDAPVKLVEYGSRTCPVCGMFGRDAMQPLETVYVASGKVSYEFREFLVHGQPDFAPALLGRCAGPAPFFGVLERMYIEQEAIEQKLGAPEGAALFKRMQGKPPLEVAKAWADYLGYIGFMKKLGMPEARARACLTNQKDFDEILKVMQGGHDKGVHGTPTFFINGKIVPDAITWPQVDDALRAAGA